MNKVNVYYVGMSGASFTKIDDYLNAYYPGLFNLIATKSITEVTKKTLSFRDFVIINLNLKPQKSLPVLKTVHKQIRKMGCTSICLTNAVDHNTISSIAEIGFDGVLIKPFNFKSFKNVIDNIKVLTFETNDYFLTIEKGRRALLHETNYTKSYTIFKKAIESNVTPSLGYYYLGKTCEYMNRDVNAINHYRRGLRLNKWHFKSLVSLLGTYVRHRDNDEAFTLLKHITKTYPESPERFCLAVKLAIKNFKFDEIPSLSDTFEIINNRTESIDKHYFAALYVSAKYFLNKDKMGQANTIVKTLLRLSKDSPYYKSLTRDAYRHFGKTEDFKMLELAVA